MMKYIKLSKKARNRYGEVYGRLVALGPVGQLESTQVLWLCLCNCGTLLVVAGGHLGHQVNSCGCWQRESSRTRNRKHGMYGTPIYRTWQRIKRRCLSDPDKNDHFEDYAGRGISIYGDWTHSFEAFFAHVSQLPHFGEEGMTLDRINNDGNYEPGNVRWATTIEQGRNKRSNRLLTIEGKTQTVAAWIEELQLNKATVQWRLRQGWSPERALGLQEWTVG